MLFEKKLCVGYLHYGALGTKSQGLNEVEVVATKLVEHDVAIDLTKGHFKPECTFPLTQCTTRALDINRQLIPQASPTLNLTPIFTNPMKSH